MDMERLKKQFDFCREIDQAKFIARQTYLTGAQRMENDAEHAWHIAVMALVLSEYSNEDIDLLRTISMLLIHDLVEIYAGDTYAYDTEAQKTQKQRELAAADRLFGLLPTDQQVKFRALWDEFEAEETPESKFAHTLDHVQPTMLQAATNGKRWQEKGICLNQVLERNRTTADGSDALWAYSRQEFIEPFVQNGILKCD